MKRLFTLFFTGYFLLLAVGVGISSHYCGGVLKSMAIMVEAPACGHQDMSKDHCAAQGKKGKDCCDEEYQLVKLVDSYTPVDVVASSPDWITLGHIPAEFINTAELAVSHQTDTYQNKPPPLTVTQLLSRLQVYLC